jgi:hypothetical protein
MQENLQENLATEVTEAGMLHAPATQKGIVICFVT